MTPILPRLFSVDVDVVGWHASARLPGPKKPSRSLPKVRILELIRSSVVSERRYQNRNRVARTRDGRSTQGAEERPRQRRHGLGRRGRLLHARVQQQPQGGRLRRSAKTPGKVARSNPGRRFRRLAVRAELCDGQD